MMIINISSEEYKIIIKDLTDFIHRVATNEKATPAELAALPEVAKTVLLNVSLTKVGL